MREQVDTSNELGGRDSVKFDIVLLAPGCLGSMVDTFR